MDGFNFEDVDWGELNLLDNEIMSSTDAKDHNLFAVKGNERGMLQ
ncbi:hypothetical protein bthur0011_57710 [Bacillus thuringiensis serovar huazhongensis BGSC 4BD1]|nr:hypothetical protein bthur0011_57710 [Bacillus thuringiensis serovar huazhongensis BGSC 4BD1]